MSDYSNDNDPFLQVQQDVLAQLSTTRTLFTSYQRILAHNTSRQTPETLSASADLTTALTSLTEDLTDLSATVEAVEASPSIFGVSLSEVTRRRKLVQDVTAELSAMRRDLQNPAGFLSPSAFDLKGDRDNDYDGDYTAEFEQLQQREIMRAQDEQLDDVFQTVGNLRRQADDMGRELEEQREMLEDVDNVVERVSGRLQVGMQKMQYVIRRNEDTLSSCCIGVLIIVLIILLVLLLIL